MEEGIKFAKRYVCLPNTCENVLHAHHITMNKHAEIIGL